MQSAHRWQWVVSLTHWQHFTSPRRFLILKPRDIVLLLEEFGKLKQFGDVIKTRTRDLSG
jgi:hypothetical protein